MITSKLVLIINKKHMNYRSIFKQNKLPLLLIALAFPVSVTTSSLYATTTEVTITQQKKP